MSEWILIDADRVIDLGTAPDEVERKLLDLLPTHQLSSPNAIVDIGSPHDATIAVGIAGSRGYVEFGTKDGDPPYYRVIEPSLSRSNDDVAFTYKGERTSLPAKNCVALGVLLRILKHFIATESIPEWVITEEA